jgi:hypothetical protein
MSKKNLVAYFHVNINYIYIINLSFLYFIFNVQRFKYNKIKVVSIEQMIYINKKKKFKNSY